MRTTSCSTPTRTRTPAIGEMSIGPSPREQPPEQPQVRLADVVQEPLQPVQRVRQPDPRRDDVDEDQQDVDADEDVDEVLRGRDRVASRPIVAKATPTVRDSAPRAHHSYYRAATRAGRRSERLGLIEEAAAFEHAGALFRGDLDVPRREQEDLVGDALHAAVEGVGQPAGEVDQALGELLVGRLQVEDHRRRVLELVGDLLGVVEAARDDEVDVDVRARDGLEPARPLGGSRRADGA